MGEEIERLEGAAESREGAPGAGGRGARDVPRPRPGRPARRAAWGDELVEAIHREIGDLGLEQARMEVALERRRREGSSLEVDGVPVGC